MTSNLDKQKFNFHCQYNVNRESFEGKRNIARLRKSESLRQAFYSYRRLVFKKLFLCVDKYAEYGFDQQRLMCYVCRLWDMVFS